MMVVMVMVIVVAALMMVMVVIITFILHKLNVRPLHAGKVVAKKDRLSVLHGLEQIRIGIGGREGGRDGAC